MNELDRQAGSRATDRGVVLRNKGTNNTLPEKKEVLLNREYISLLCDIWLSLRSSSVVLSMKNFCFHPRAQEITVAKIAPFVLCLIVK